VVGQELFWAATIPEGDRLNVSAISGLTLNHFRLAALLASTFEDTAMKASFLTALMAASILAEPALAQSPPTNAPAPAPTVAAPAILPGAPVAPLTSGDAQFVQSQIEGNMAEYQAGQLALQRSQNQDVRNFAQKMITDHTYAQDTLAPIAQAHHIQASGKLSEQDRVMLGQLAQLNGPAFDRAYVDDMVRAHAAMVAQLNAQLIHGEDQHINAWVQNTRPIVLQHSEIAQQLLASLPHTG
jgi:putative membrane protein